MYKQHKIYIARHLHILNIDLCQNLPEPPTFGGLFRYELSHKLNGEDWILLVYRSTSRHLRGMGEKGHTATRLGAAGQKYDWVYLDEHAMEASEVNYGLGNQSD